MLIPPVLQVPTTPILDYWAKRAPFDMSAIALGAFAVNIAAGFLVLTRGVTSATRFAIAFGYFPAMAGVLFLETLHMSVRFLGGDNF